MLGNRNSGKSLTWNTLFGREVRRGKTPRKLEVSPQECVEVFLVSGSFEERGEYAGDILGDQDCKIVLCSVQYTDEAMSTFDYVAKNEFQIYTQWINPGYHDASRKKYFDSFGLLNQILSHGGVISMRNGQERANARVREIREFIHGWAASRQLIVSC